ncbi:unnamed protein product [Colias eurytheme]|nr:unnamed protein product [Colias eurytheme]
MSRFTTFVPIMYRVDFPTCRGDFLRTKQWGSLGTTSQNDKGPGLGVRGEAVWRDSCARDSLPAPPHSAVDRRAGN